MKINTLGYSVKQGFKNIQRNLLFSLASTGTIVACIFLFGIFYSIFQNVEQAVQSIEGSLKVSVFFEEGIDEETIVQIGNELKDLKNVDTINYISADKAWKGYIEDVYGGDEEYVNSVFGEDNPLQNSASYELTLKDISQQAATVKKLNGISGVRRVNSSEGTAQSLNSLGRLVGYASVSIIIILLLVSLFLISNTITIGISVRKEEIAIMKLIGATDFFVRAPFLIEGVILGLAGSIIPVTGLYFIYKGTVKYLIEHFAIVENMVKFVPAGDVFKGLVPISILFGVGVGLLGSLLTTQRHIHV